MGVKLTIPGAIEDAVFYEVYVRGFFDSNADGIGDFNGLTEKLDYLEWLGVNCIWLLPMYVSPLRDGGYDISDYYSILPEYGSSVPAGHIASERPISRLDCHSSKTEKASTGLKCIEHV